MFQKITNGFVKMMYTLADILHLDSPVRVIILIADVAIVVFLIYYIYKIIKQTRAEQIMKGILILLLFSIMSNVFDMVILKYIFANFMTYGMLLIIVVFQPELRSAFEKIGRSSKISNVFDMEDDILIKHSISEIVKAVEIMSLKKIGVLIVIEGETKISEVVKEGVNLSAKVSSELLQNIFMPRTPLHDGAVIIDKSQILAAKCILPLSSENNVERKLGTRHRAAVGITEISDALAIVVSEETGIISIAQNGKLKRELNCDQLKDILIKKTDRPRTLRALKNIRKE